MSAVVERAPRRKSCPIQLDRARAVTEAMGNVVNAACDRGSVCASDPDLTRLGDADLLDEHVWRFGRL